MLARKRVRLILLIAVLVAIYPAFVLGYTWSHVLGSDLPGGKNGPLDAYRHTLASAVVAYTIGPGAVDFVSRTMERKGNLANQMDIHNNRVGASIGSTATSFSDIEPLVSATVRRGKINAASPDQTTWLEPTTWGDGILH